MSRTNNIIFLDDGSAITNLMPFKYHNEPKIIIPRDNILNTAKKINEIINRTGWVFQTDESKLNLGLPFIKLTPRIFQIKSDFTVKDVFDYWESNTIHIDCLLAFNILILFYLKLFILSDDDLETLRSCFNIDISCGIMHTGIHEKIKSFKNVSFPLCNLEYQKEIVEHLPPGCYLYIRGSIGWYDWIYNDFIKDKNKLNTVFQGENAISIGYKEFITFSRDYNGVKFPHPQLVIKSFDYILNELNKNGMNEMAKVYPNDSLLTFVTFDEQFIYPKNAVAGIECAQYLTISL